MLRYMYSKSVRHVTRRKLVKNENFHRMRVQCASSDAAHNDEMHSRAFLYVPGSDRRKLEKSFQLRVDCLLLNCEDGVAANMKDEARKNIRDILDNPPRLQPFTQLAVRVNELTSAHFARDIEAFLTAKTLPKYVFFPKVHTPTDVQKISTAMTQYLPSDAVCNAVFYIESAVSLMYLKDICFEAIHEGRSVNFKLAGLVFGGDDYLASIGATKTKKYEQIVYARQKIVNVCKALHLQPIDIVHNNVQDLKELEEECLDGARMGYTGKQVIHPIQVETVQNAFKPSEEQIMWAKRLLEEYAQHEQRGKGAFIFRGLMIDAPLVKQARNILRLVERLK